MAKASTANQVANNAKGAVQSGVDSATTSLSGAICRVRKAVGLDKCPTCVICSVIVIGACGAAFVYVSQKKKKGGK